MISHYSSLEQLIRGTSGHRNPLAALPNRLVFNFKRWLVNRRELRDLDADQLYDVGLSREKVEQACSFSLLRQ